MPAAIVVVVVVVVVVAAAVRFWSFLQSAGVIQYFYAWSLFNILSLVLRDWP